MAISFAWDLRSLLRKPKVERFLQLLAVLYSAGIPCHWLELASVHYSCVSVLFLLPILLERLVEEEDSTGDSNPAVSAWIDTRLSMSSQH